MKLKRFHKALQKSPQLAAKVLIDRVADRIQEQRLGIRSSGFIPIETLIKDWNGYHDYAPTSIHSFRAFMRAAEIVEGRDVFVDYGCGMGRTLVLASEYPFRKCIGVEISKTLAAIARENLAKHRGRRQCHDIQVWCGSAEHFELPCDASVLYFFNPFHGTPLTGVFDRIDQSLAACPRRIQIIFNNPVHFLPIAHRYSWLVAKQSFSFEHDCIVYENRVSRQGHGL
jgi:SAM-dependent methyltransferase